MSKLDLFRDHLNEREYRYREAADDAGKNAGLYCATRD